MTLFPSPIEQRHAAAMVAIRQDIRKLQTRTAGIDSGFPLMALPATIDPAYTTGDPHAFINGSTTLTGPYQHLASYTPVASASVVVLPVPALQTYIVLGSLA